LGCGLDSTGCRGGLEGVEPPVCGEAEISDPPEDGAACVEPVTRVARVGSVLA
jgi:hypothetical protein